MLPVGPDGAGVAGGVAAGGVAGVVDPDAAGAPGVAGADGAGAGAGAGPGVPLMIDPDVVCWPMIASASAPIMNAAARPAVSFDNSVAPVRAPNAELLLPPPKAAAISPLPCCSRITSRSTRQTST